MSYYDNYYCTKVASEKDRARLARKNRAENVELDDGNKQDNNNNNVFNVYSAKSICSSKRLTIKSDDIESLK